MASPYKPYDRSNRFASIWKPTGDEKERERHAADLEIETGVSLFTDEDRPWRATRGEKLRTCAFLKIKYEEILTQRNSTFRPETAMAVLLEEIFGDARRRDPVHTLLVLLENLVQSIKEETDPGWDWTEGLKAQIEQMRFLKGMYETLFD